MADYEYDLYSGFGSDQSHGMTSGDFPLAQRPGTQARLTTGSQRAGLTPAVPVSRRGTASGTSRPLTAIRGAGYTSSGARTMIGAASSSSAAAHAGKTAGSLSATTVEVPAEERVRQLERRVMQLVEESCQLPDGRKALDKAKEASTKERSLIRLREQAALVEAHNLDLTFVVLTNLAWQYENNELYAEALNAYQIITKNKAFSNASRIKVNIANIYFKMGQYSKALKFYRMALDQVPSGQNSVKIKIMHNIGLLFVRMGHYTDAVTSFEYCMHQQPSFRTGLNLIMCYHTLNDKVKQRETFQAILQVPFDTDSERRLRDLEEDAKGDAQVALVLEAIKNDEMSKLERRMRQEAEYCILTAAKMISGGQSSAVSEDYNWCVEQLKDSQHSDLANELEINRAVMYLRQKDLKSAVDILELFNKVDTKVASHAFTNLSFIYFLQGDWDQAESYAAKARDADGYNAAALVNLGNCFYQRKSFDKAMEFYVCALDVDASCVQALFNMGLTHKSMGQYQEALDVFTKLHAVVHGDAQVVYQIGNCYELLGESDHATEWFLQMLSLVPSDPDVLLRMGSLLDKEGDEQAAYQYYIDSSRFFPANLEVIEWLSSYFIQHQVPEKAIQYLERAALIQPDEVRWRMMVASCHRTAGNYQLALLKYKQIHAQFPDDIEALRHLVRICSDLGLREAAEYTAELRRVQKARELREERLRSGRPATSYRAGVQGSRTSSAASWQSSGQGSRPGSLAPAHGAASSSSAEQERRNDRADLDLAPGSGASSSRVAQALTRDDSIFDDDVAEDLLPE